MFLTAIWNILSKLEPYTAQGYLDPSPPLAREISADDALKMLKSRGYIINGDLLVSSAA